MHSIVYMSRALLDFSLSDLRELNELSAYNNARRGVSGFLLLQNEHFLQYLEGELIQINETYRHIVQDPRHGGCVLLSLREIPARRFGQWHMRLLDFDRVSALFKDRPPLSVRETYYGAEENLESVISQTLRLFDLGR